MSSASKARVIPDVVPIHGRRAALPHSLIGWLVDFDADGVPRVDYAGNGAGPLPAVIATPVSDDELRVAVLARREVVLLFDGDDPSKPVVVGLVKQPHARQPEPSDGPAIDVRVDGQDLAFRAREQISFQCGEASITLRKDGKIVIRGAFVESHATGTNRIKGAAVKIN